MTPTNAALAAAALDAVPVETAVLDAQGVVLSVNRAWAQSGAPGAVGESYPAVCGAELAAGVRDVLEGRREVFALSHTVAGPTGQRWLESTAQRFETQGLTAVLVSHADVTAHAQAQAALREREAQYRGVVEDQLELICRYRPDTTLTFVNDAYCRHFQRTREQLIGRPFLELIPESDWDGVRQTLALLNAENPTHDYTHQVIHSDGSRGWQHWTDRAICDDAGRVVEFQAVGRDITAIKFFETALADSERRFRELADNVAEVFWVFDWRQRRLDYVSPAYERLFGRRAEDVLADPAIWTEAVHPEDRERVNEMFRTADRGPYEDRYRVCRADGSVRWVRDRGRPLRDEHGDVLRIVGIAEDITAQVRAEEAMRRSEDRYRAALEGSLDAFYLLEAVRDDDGTITDFVFADVNERGAELISRPRVEVVGQLLCELMPVNRTGGFFDKYAGVVASRRPIMDEFPIDAADEGVRATWLQYQVVPVGDGVAVIVRDVSDRKADEHALARQYRETQLILDSVPAFIWYKDTKNTILRVNRAVADSLGLSAEQIEGRPTEDFYPEQAAAYYRDDVAVLESGQPKLGYVEAMDLPGVGMRQVQTDKVPLYDDAGHAVGVIVIASDVTDRRTAEIDRAVLEKAEEERRQIGRELHDGIGQQLTGLAMLVESCRRRVARGGAVEPSTIEEVGRIVAASNTEVRRLISGLTPDPIAAYELPAALRQMAGNVETFFSVRVRADCDDSPAALTDAQADHLLRIAQEAAHNAARHGHADQINLVLLVEDDTLTLTVTDDGRGLAHPDSEPTATAGTGRGLRIMRHRADMISGTLSVSPAPRGGTCIRVTMPLTGPPDSDSADLLGVTE